MKIIIEGDKTEIFSQLVDVLKEIKGSLENTDGKTLVPLSEDAQSVSTEKMGKIEEELKKINISLGTVIQEIKAWRDNK